MADKSQIRNSGLSLSKTVLLIALPVIVLVILFFSSSFFFFLPAQKSKLMDSKREMIRELTSIAWKLLDSYHIKEQSGELTLEEAKANAKADIRALRYGSEGKNYFWINDLYPRIIIHPYRTDLEAQDVSDFQDSEGKYLFLEFIKVIEKSEAGYVEYSWQWKDNPDCVVPKLSYIKLFKPWSWVIGTGIYVEDVNQEISVLTQRLYEFCFLVLFVILILSIFVVWFSKKSKQDLFTVYQSLRISEEKYRGVVENAQEAIAVAQGGFIKYVNPIFSHIAGRPESEIFNSRFIDFVHPDDQKILLDRHQKRLNGEEIDSVYEVRILTKDGKLKWLEIKVVSINWENKPATLNFISDITKRQLARQALEESEKRLSILQNSIQTGILLIDQETRRIVEANPAAIKMIGDTIENIIGSECHRYIYTKDKEKCPITDLNQLVDNTESNLIGHDNQITPIIKTAVALTLDNRSYILESFIDITKRKHAEEALKTAHAELEKRVEERTRELKIANDELKVEIIERKLIEEKLRFAKTQAETANETKTEFLANISHELRTPMHAILSFSQFGIKKIDKVPKEKLLHYFTQTNAAGKRLMLLLNDLLDLSKLEAGKIDFRMKENDLWQIAKEAVSEFVPMANEKNIWLEILETKLPLKVVCDNLKIGQILRNLLVNAINFSPAQKKVIVSFAPTVIPLNQGDDSPKEISAIKVIVKDNGIGIPSSELQSIFDKFYQSSKTNTGAGGTGLGLAICSELIKGHNGEIWAKNNPEGGASFIFTLPYG